MIPNLFLLLSRKLSLFYILEFLWIVFLLYVNLDTLFIVDSISLYQSSRAIEVLLFFLWCQAINRIYHTKLYLLTRGSKYFSLVCPLLLIHFIVSAAKKWFDINTSSGVFVRYLIYFLAERLLFLFVFRLYFLATKLILSSSDSCCFTTL